MRILFCGSGAFAVPSLRAILFSGHEVVDILTQPARPAGRGGKVRPTPLAEAARAAGREPVECPDINAPDVADRLRAMRPDVLCVADFGQMVRRAVREAAALDAINLHGSLLPALRGAAPVNWAIIRGLKRTGVTTFSLVAKMDAGAMYVQIPTDIRPEETAEELKSRLAEIGAEAVLQTLDLLASGRAQKREQDHELATLAPLMTKADGLVDWSAGAETIRNRIHGTWPWPGGQAVLKRRSGADVPVILARTAAEEGLPGEGGRLDEHFRVSAGGGGLLRILELQPAGKRLMTWRDFVNGYRPAAGDRFVRPEG